MATKKQKEELMQTLKFTPVRAQILLQGYGGECYIGSVSREDYEFFKSKRIDISQYASDWDDAKWKDIPAKHRIFEPGSPYDCDDRFHQSGATMDDSSYLTVLNAETGDTIFETSLDISHLEEQGIGVDCSDDFETADCEPGSVFFWGGQGEKGCFFDGEITLRASFDPAKLRISYGNGDDWYLSSGVEYAGEEVEGYDGYSTSGKWTEHKFWIVGDEEVYEGEEREDDYEPENICDIPVLDGEEEWAQRAIDSVVSFTEEQKTDWHPREADPVHEGVYEVLIDAPWPGGGPGVAEWRSGEWLQDGKSVAIHKWRGLKEPA